MGIYTTTNSVSYNSYYSRNGLAYHVDGTSFSAPIVTGVVALIKSIRPDLSPARIKNCILETAYPCYYLSNKVHSGGTVNAADAIDYALEEDLAGDVNQDGVVDSIDVELVRRVVAGLDTVTDITYYDAYYDGSVDAKDILVMNKYINGYQTAFLGPN